MANKAETNGIGGHSTTASAQGETSAFPTLQPVPNVSPPNGKHVIPSDYPVLQDVKGRPWWKGVVAYQIWPRSFKDSGANGIGDLQGIISKLDYLKDLGIDVIWISPTFDSPQKDWGYDISNYETMHRDFGTLEDMQQLIDEAHNRDIKILLDLVITHTSDEHPWFLESRKSRDNPKSDWYMWADKRPGNMIDGEMIEEPSNWRAAFGGSAWEWVPEREQYFIHLFLKSQPDLNWECEAMRDAIYLSAVKFWLDRGVDGFRIDTANRFCKDPNYPDAQRTVAGRWQPGSKYYINGPKMHVWLKELRARMVADFPEKDLMLVGELPLTPYEELLRYVSPEEKELSMVFDFDMVKLGNNDNPDEIAKHEVSNYMDKDKSYTLPLFKQTVKKVQSLITDTNAWGTVFMENHDQGRSIPRYATPNSKYWRQAGKILAMLQTTLSGTQFIYQGQEIGMLNMPHGWGNNEFKDPDTIDYIETYIEMNHKHDPRASDKAREGVFKVGRDNGRTPMQWSNSPNGGFTGANPCWMRVNDNYSYINVEAQQQDPDSIFHFWKKHIAMRKDYKELFMFGTFALYDIANERMMTYTKMSTDGQMALIILNFSDDDMPLNTLQRHLLGHTYRLMSSNVQKPGDHLEPWEGRVYMVRDGLEADMPGQPSNIGQLQDLMPTRAKGVVSSMPMTGHPAGHQPRRESKLDGTQWISAASF
ncbi:Alpha-glucosidase [Fulvia fulva]|uniref:Alpha-glucosidase n=1 Tax=Passalora fulva TaxID=5499 RepID=A0A9Q8USB9_PASFU|nr:Alpha-glucosidase [Fulvia fulva]KAK4618592.1 Alpha-glucosidase [Fulvia fulva]UJO20621.1 Alpha-glucosidase [Fulvia fulva]